MHNGSLSVDGQKLYEAQPGLFFASDGEAIDFRGRPATWRNIELSRITIPSWQWALLGFSFLALQVTLALRRLLVRRRGESAPAAGSTRRSRARRTVAGVALGIAALNALLSLGLVAVLAQYPYLIGDGLPSLRPGLPAASAVLTCLPLAICLLTVLMVLCTFLAARGRLWSWGGRVYYLLNTCGAAAFVALMVLWRLLERN